MGKTYIGIDPGLSGGIAIIHGDNYVRDFDISVHVMPIRQTNKGKNELDITGLRSLLKDILFPNFEKGRFFVVMEKVSAMPGQGVSSMFSFGKTAGALQAVVEMLKWPYDLVTPQAWQKEMLAGTSGDSKARAAIVARRLFPDIDFRATLRSSKMHDGMVDALLMAEYGRRKRL